MLFILIILNVYARVAASSSCTGETPLELPVTDVLLANGQTMRGVWTSVGTPAQNISLFPKVFLNDTWIYNTTSPFCDADDMNLNTAECTTLRGGLYSPGNSSTSIVKANVYAAGADASDTADSRNDGSTHVWINDWVQDSFHLGNMTLANYSIGMPGMDISSQWVTMANLGLNSNSTVLTALKAAGRIASRSYSWWWGIDSGPNQMDGSIVFGGYDAAKTDGHNFSLPVVASTIGCPGGMYVTVTDLQLNFKNGSNASIMGGKPAFSACLEPDWSTVMSFDIGYFDTFTSMTQTSQIGREEHPGFTFWGLLYDPNNVYDGGLTITLNNAYSVEIPNDILVISPQYVESDGSVHTNDSVREMLINPLVDVTADTTPYIGKQFFSQTYLTVDFDASTFYLSQARASKNSDLVRIGGPCASATTTSTTVSTTARTQELPDTSRKGEPLSTGAIAGIAIGAAAGMALVLAIAIAVFIVRRRKQRPRRRVTTDMISRPGDGMSLQELKAELDATQTLQELNDSSPAYQELMGTSHMRHELHWQSRPAELAEKRYTYRKGAGASTIYELDGTGLNF